MPSSPLPSLALVTGADAVTAVFGRFDLHDAELRALRLGHAPGAVPFLELDLQLPGELAVPPGTADRRLDYRVTLRFSDVADLSLADFEEQNVVAEYAFDVVQPAPDDDRAVAVTITSAPGADLELRCRAVAVRAVEPITA